MSTQFVQLHLGGYRRIGLFGLLFLSFALSDYVAAAPSWSYQIRSDALQPLLAQDAVGLSDGGFVVSGEDASRRRWALRYSADGSQISKEMVEFFAPSSDNLLAHGLSLTYLPHFDDGIGVLTPSRLCQAERGWLGGLDLRSFDSLVRPNFWEGEAVARTLDSGGGHIGQYSVYSSLDIRNYVTRFARDCSRTVLLANSDAAEVAAIPNAEGAYVFASRYLLGQPVDSPALLRVLRGGEAWRYPLPVPAGDAVRDVRLRATPNGDALVFRSFGSPQVRSELVRIGADGKHQWTQAQTGGNKLVALAADRQRTYSVFSDGSTQLAQAVDPEGRALWEQRLDSNRLIGQLHSARVAAAPLWRLRSLTSQTQGDALVRPGAEGVEPVLTLRAGLEPLSELVDGSVLVLEPDLTRLLRIGPVGAQERPIAPAVPERTRIAGLHLDHEGAFLVTVDHAKIAELHHLSTSGQLRWRTRLPASPADGSPHASDARHWFAANSRRVCLWRAGDFAITAAIVCLARNDGHLLHGWIEAPASTLYGDATIHLRDDGGLDAIGSGCQVDFPQPSESCAHRAYRVHIGAQGGDVTRTLLAEVPGREGGVATAGSPDRKLAAVAIYRNASRQATLAMHELSGAVRWSITVDTAGVLLPLVAGDDGSVVARTESGLADFDSQGERRWIRPWPAGFRGDYSSAIVLPDGDRIVFVSDGQSSTYRARLRAMDGSVVWQHFSRDRYQFESTFFARATLAVTAGMVFLTPERGLISQQRVRGFDLVKGVAVTSFAPATPIETRYPHLPTEEVALRKDGSLLIASSHDVDGQLGVTFRPSTPAPGIVGGLPLPALLGTWAAMDTPGQGLLLDFDPAQRLVHGGWFTYTRAGGHDAAEQRWYTLAGAAEASQSAAHAIALDLYRSSQGQFAGGPSVDAQRVGSAVVRLLDCDRALLVYHFDSSIEGGAEGVIPLQRVTPRSRACGAAAADMTAVMPSHGLDPRSSGAWYEPQRSGQGLLFDLRPPQGDDPGLFVGGWFTYDVDGSSDDPTSQHWFTLAGNLSASVDGSLEVPITRTIGGSLDAEPTNNTWSVGRARIRFTSCNRATLDYTFDESDIAGAFAGRRGQLTLHRIADCAG